MGAKLIVVVLDNRGFGCINRLQQATGGAPFNNLLGRAHARCRRSTSPPMPRASARASEKVGGHRRAGGRAGARPGAATAPTSSSSTPTRRSPPRPAAPGGTWPCRRCRTRAEVRAARAAYDADASSQRWETEALTIRFGVSPIAWVNDDMPELGGDTPLETILADARDIGFAGVELGGKFPRDPAVAEAAAGRLRPRPGRRLVLAASCWPATSRPRSPRRGPPGAAQGHGLDGFRPRRDQQRHPRPARHAAQPNAAAGRGGWAALRRAADRLRRAMSRARACGSPTTITWARWSSGRRTWKPSSTSPAPASA